MFNWLKKLILDTFYQKRANTFYVRFHPKVRQLIFTNVVLDNCFEAPELDFIKNEIKENFDLDYAFWFINKNKQTEKWGSLHYAIDYEVTWDNQIILNPNFRELKIENLF